MIKQPSRTTLRMTFLAFAVVGLAACEEEGTAEEIGESIDKTAEELKKTGEELVGK